jgi:hypothetical protein
MKKLLPNIKSLLSGSKPIKYTPKGVRYTFFQDKSFIHSRKGYGGKGKISFFSDFGNKACFTDVRYNKIDNKLLTSDFAKYWFKVKNNRMYISDSSGFRNNERGYKIISGSPTKIKFNIYGGKRNLKPDIRLKSFLIKWAAENGVNLPIKYKDEGLYTVCLLLCYPELTYFIDFCKKSPTFLSSVITSDLRGIKGLNHGLDRLCGFHGKKLKEYLLKGSENSNYRFYSCLAFCKMVKNLIRDDDILSLFEQDGEGWVWVDGLELKDYKYIRYLIKNYPRDSITNWFSRYQNRHYLVDAAKQLYINHQSPENKIAIPKTNNLREIHDIITGNVRRMAMSGNYRKIDYEKINKEYKDYEFNLDELKIRLPINSEDLISSSGILSNCLSGYISWHGKDGIILLVEKEGLEYAIAIGRQKDLQQFYGKHNAPPDKEDYLKVTNYLISKKLILNHT